MKVTTRGERLVVNDTPLGAWLLGLVCTVSGAAVMLIPIVTADGQGWRPRDRAIISLLIGLPFLLCGLLMIRLHPATRTVLDRASGEGTHVFRRPGTRGAVTTRFQLRDVRSLDLIRTRDDDGDAMLQLRLWLAESRTLLLQARATHGEEQATRVANAVREFVGLPVS